MTLEKYIERPEQGPPVRPTTVKVDSLLYQKARAKMKQKNLTFRQVVEAALRMLLEEK
jgi:hypothetical protein